VGTPNIPISSGTVPPTVPGSPTAPAQSITFGLQNVAPPSPLYIQRDDQLVLQVSSNAAMPETVTVFCRLLLPTGQIVSIQQSVRVTVSFTQRFAVVTLAEGYLLSAIVVASSALGRGQTFARAWINRGIATGAPVNAALMLFSDYVTNQAAVGWPNGRTIYPTENTGLMNAVNVANPAAGADWNFQTNAIERSRIIAIRAQLAASATVANRTPAIRVRDAAGDVMFIAGNNNNQVASATQGYSYGQGVPLGQSSATEFFAPLPDNLVIAGGQQIGSITAGIQAGDQWSNIWLLIEDWLDFS
jgi:hypothetical protein